MILRNTKGIAKVMMFNSICAQKAFALSTCLALIIPNAAWADDCRMYAERDGPTWEFTCDGGPCPSPGCGLSATWQEEDGFWVLQCLCGPNLAAEGSCQAIVYQESGSSVEIDCVDLGCEEEQKFCTNPWPIGSEPVALCNCTD